MDCSFDVRGRRSAVSTQPDTLSDGLPGDGPRNPFTPKRAQVVCILLTAPELVESPLRDIAECAGVSVGMAKETLDTLRTTGFLEQLGSRRRVVRAGELLDLWAAAYPGSLGRANRLFVASGDVHAWSAPEGLPVAVSGEQAVPDDIRNPESLVLYVDTVEPELPTELLIHNRWHRDAHGSIVIRKLFWRNLPDQRPGLAPAALIYADLLASHEPRQLEVAHHMRRQDDRLARL